MYYTDPPDHPNKNHQAANIAAVTGKSCAKDDSKEGPSNSVKGKRVLELSEWHRIMGHCNVGDLLKLENEVQGMKIKKDRVDCETCILGKMNRSFSRTPDERAKGPLEMVHTDLCGPIDPVALGGFKYAFNIVDDYSGTIFVYFLKAKSETPMAMEKFLADTAPYGKVKILNGDIVKTLRSDNGGEYVSKQFEQIMVKNKIKHEFSAPESPHQNGTAERSWRTLFEMARCLLIESKLPQNLWTYAVMCSAYIRNRCYNQRTKSTPYFMLTGKKPDVSKLHVFGSVCYSHQPNAKKLQPRGKKGLFVGYDRSSPAYLVYDQTTKKVSKHRCVTFTEKLKDPVVPPSKGTTSAAVPKPQQMQRFYGEFDDDFPGHLNIIDMEEVLGNIDPDLFNEDNIINNNNDVDHINQDNNNPNNYVNNNNVADNNNNNNHNNIYIEEIEPVVEEIHIENDDPTEVHEEAEHENVTQRRNPARNRVLPSHLDDYEVNTSVASEPDWLDSSGEEDVVAVVHYCYSASEVAVPKTYDEAISCDEAEAWKTAMDNEMNSILHNNTYSLVELPPGKSCIGSRWVYKIKSGPDGEEIFKARYCAKGYTQKYGIDFSETFAPTAHFTTIRIFMQLAVEMDLMKCLVRA